MFDRTMYYYTCYFPTSIEQTISVERNFIPNRDWSMPFGKIFDEDQAISIRLVRLLVFFSFPYISQCSSQLAVAVVVVLFNIMSHQNIIYSFDNCFEWLVCAQIRMFICYRNHHLKIEWIYLARQSKTKVTKMCDYAHNYFFSSSSRQGKMYQHLENQVHRRCTEHMLRI